MRLLFVTDSLDRFGATYQLNILTYELASSHELHVAVLGGGHEIPTGLEQKEDRRTFHFLGNSNSTGLSWRTMAQSGMRLRELIQRLNPDVLHAWCHPADRIALAAATGIESMDLFVTELYQRPSTNMTTEAIDRKLARRVTKCIVSHEELRRSLLGQPYSDDQLSVIPSAIGCDNPSREVARRKLVQLGGFSEHVNIAGAVAPLVPRSRLKDLVWATDLLTCVRDDVYLFIFGRGSQRRRLERFAFQTEAGQHIHFVDSEIDAVALIPGLDFFWQSHLNEPLPSAMRYAMSHAIPVVSVYGPGTSELIEHQATGFATNFGARDEFARWTKYLLEQEESANQLAVQGQASIKTEPSIEDIARRYIDTYSIAASQRTITV